MTLSCVQHLCKNRKWFKFVKIARLRRYTHLYIVLTYSTTSLLSKYLTAESIAHCALRICRMSVCPRKLTDHFLFFCFILFVSLWALIFFPSKVKDDYLSMPVLTKVSAISLFLLWSLKDKLSQLIWINLAGKFTRFRFKVQDGLLMFVRLNLIDTFLFITCILYFYCISQSYFVLKEVFYLPNSNYFHLLRVINRKDILVSKCYNFQYLPSVCFLE